MSAVAFPMMMMVLVAMMMMMMMMIVTMAMLSSIIRAMLSMMRRMRMVMLFVSWVSIAHAFFSQTKCACDNKQQYFCLRPGMVAGRKASDVLRGWIER